MDVRAAVITSLRLASTGSSRYSHYPDFRNVEIESAKVNSFADSSSLSLDEDN